MTRFRSLFHPVTRAVCPLQGMKCHDDECDCEQLCGSEYSAFTIMALDEDIYVMNTKLTPGTYCLPKGIGTCNQETSIHIFSLAGWSCLPRNHAIFRDGKKIACQSEEAENNDLNVLWDRYLNAKAQNVKDYYETFQNELRYQCHCRSKSLDGIRMISILPFTCSVDYCIRNIVNPLPNMGWDGARCQCALYPHADPTDDTSPCLAVMSEVKNNEWLGRVECMTEKSFVKKALYCPEDEPIVDFAPVPIFKGGQLFDFIEELRMKWKPEEDG